VIFDGYRGIAILEQKEYGTSTAFYYVQITSNNDKKWNIILKHDPKKHRGYRFLSRLSFSNQQEFQTAKRWFR
jgi:hypothetical protein